MSSLLFFVLFHLVTSQDRPNCNALLTPNPEFTGVVGLNYQFICYGWNTEDNAIIRWYLNDIHYENASSRDILFFNDDIGISTLILYTASSAMNNTMIFCSVIYSATLECNSTVTTLFLQGVPGPITGLNVAYISGGILDITWNSPFTLDIDHNHIDVRFNIHIAYNSLNNTQELQLLEIEQLSVQQHVTSNIAICELLNVTVTPYNIAGQGKSAMMSRLPLITGNFSVHVIGGYRVQSEIIYVLHVYPAICDVEISLTDMYNNNNITLSQYDYQLSTNSSNRSTIVINTNFMVKKNHKYIALYNHSNSNGSIFTNIISTHSIQNVTINSLIVNEVGIYVHYLVNTVARGTVLLFISETSQPVLLALSIIESRRYRLPSNFSNNRMLAYDIGENGLLTLSIVYPAIDINIPSINNNKGYSSETLNKCLTEVSIEYAVNISCDCDQMHNITGYQVVLLNVSDQRGILYTNIQDCAETATMKINNHEHYITVFAIERNKGISESVILYEGIISNIIVERFSQHLNTGIIISIPVVVVLAFLLLFSLVFGIVFPTYYYHHRKKRRTRVVPMKI